MYQSIPIDKQTYSDILVYFLNVFSSITLFYLSIYLQNFINIYFLSTEYNNPDITDAVGMVFVYCNVFIIYFICFIVQGKECLVARILIQNYFKLLKKHPFVTAHTTHILNSKNKN